MGDKSGELEPEPVNALFVLGMIYFCASLCCLSQT